MVLVDAHALQLERFAVEEEALVGIEAQRAETGVQLGGVDLAQRAGAGLAQHRPHAIQPRRSRRPERGLPDVQRQARGGRVQRGDVDAGLLPGHHGAVGAGHLKRHDRCPRGLAGVVDLHLDRQRPAAVALHRIGVQAVGGDVQRVALDQPDMAVDAGAFVPPAFLGVRVDAHRDAVHLVAVAQVGRDVDGAAVVAGPVAIHHDAVDPHRAVGRDAVELQLDVAAPVGLRQLQITPVPADASGAVALRRVLLTVEGVLDGPVVRQVQPAPVGVVELRPASADDAARLGLVVARAVSLDRRRRHFAAVEQPAGVQRQALARPLGARGSGQQRRDRQAGDQQPMNQ